MAMSGGGPQRLQINGERTSGQDVRTANVTAISAIANIVKTSLGPVGLDKARAPPGAALLPRRRRQRTAACRRPSRRCAAMSRPR